LDWHEALYHFMIQSTPTSLKKTSEISTPVCVSTAIEWKLTLSGEVLDQKTVRDSKQILLFQRIRWTIVNRQMRRTIPLSVPQHSQPEGERPASDQLTAQVMAALMADFAWRRECAFHEITATMAAHRSEIGSAQRALDERLSIVEADCLQRRENSDADRAALDENSRRIAMVESELSALQQGHTGRLAAHEAELARLSSASAAIEVATSDLRADLIRVSAAADATRSELSAIQARHAAHENAIACLSEQQRDGMRATADLTAELRLLKAEVEGLRVLEWTGRLNEHERGIARLVEGQRDVTSNLARVSAEVDGLRGLRTELSGLMWEQTERLQSHGIELGRLLQNYHELVLSSAQNARGIADLTADVARLRAGLAAAHGDLGPALGRAPPVERQASSPDPISPQPDCVALRAAGSSQRTQILVSTLEGRTLMFVVDRKICMQELRAMIKTRTGIPPDAYGLSMNGRCLDDDESLEDCNSGPNAILRMFGRLRSHG
jgi:hypothetical protein